MASAARRRVRVIAQMVPPERGRGVSVNARAVGDFAAQETMDDGRVSRASRAMTRDDALASAVVPSMEVANALATGAPVVALESTIVAHGMPYPENLRCALEVEACVAARGCVPATCAVVDGVPRVGLTRDELERIARMGERCVKASRRDLAHACGTGATAATTVSATMALARAVGVDVFVTGGIGGVHRGGEHTMDVSADLIELGRTNVAVICAGVKSILDIPRTLEVLETHGATVCAYGTDEFPAFFTRKSGCTAPARVNTPLEAARVIDASLRLRLTSGSVFAVPIPSEHEAMGETIELATAQALKEIEERGLVGRDVTPYVLKRVAELTDGASLKANIALVKNNAFIGADIAVELARLRGKATA